MLQSLNVHPVQTIGSEVIAAAQLGAVANPKQVVLCLVHAKVCFCFSSLFCQGRRATDKRCESFDWCQFRVCQNFLKTVSKILVSEFCIFGEVF